MGDSLGCILQFRNKDTQLEGEESHLLPHRGKGQRDIFEGLLAKLSKV